ncbi:hypothetical protein [Nonomuraea sp. NPDC050310]|uniref:hypothetical protein n=1 Tax=unclassified Nonomuraea TaxID=2593643 RepID=UPI003400B757
MPNDPDHVLDAIDGAVEDWETVSADAMRWAPPEEKPAPPSPAGDLLKDLGEIFAPLTAVFRTLGATVLEAPPVRRFIELVEEPLSAEPALEVDEEQTSCHCLCFRHADRPGICTGQVDGRLAGVQMCEPCLDAAAEPATRLAHKE